jgi:hypothetical protein
VLALRGGGVRGHLDEPVERGFVKLGLIRPPADEPAADGVSGENDRTLFERHGGEFIGQLG